MTARKPGRTAARTAGQAPDRRAARDARTPAAARIDRLRSYRTRADQASPIGLNLASIRRDLTQREASIAPALEAWTEIIPKELAERATIVSLSRGTLTVRIPDSASRFATDRLLRAGAQIRIIKRCPRPVRRIKLVP
ncbi:MAG: DciA family protein [Planctomycetota bacterium]